MKLIKNLRCTRALSNVFTTAELLENVVSYGPANGNVQAQCKVRSEFPQADKRRIAYEFEKIVCLSKFPIAFTLKSDLGIFKRNCRSGFHIAANFRQGANSHKQFSIVRCIVY
jgi:hypothetical protein